jgi:Scavenger receptor cysteine-rich domain/Tyrosine-protein kinase ephrin type A/B receptor-like
MGRDVTPTMTLTLCQQQPAPETRRLRVPNNYFGMILSGRTWWLLLFSHVAWLLISLLCIIMFTSLVLVCGSESPGPGPGAGPALKPLNSPESETRRGNESRPQQLLLGPGSDSGLRTLSDSVTQSRLRLGRRAATVRPSHFNRDASDSAAAAAAASHIVNVITRSVNNSYSNTSTSESIIERRSRTTRTMTVTLFEAASQTLAPGSLRLESVSMSITTSRNTPTGPPSQIHVFGRLNIYNGEQWGTVCGTSTATSLGQVACRQLGMGYNTISRYYNGGQNGNSLVLMGQVQCTGAEATLNQCQWPGFISNNGQYCSGHHSYDIAVTCVVIPCPSGWYYSVTDLACQPFPSPVPTCPAGFGFGVVGCDTPCDPGYASTVDTSCIACSIGKYSRGEGQSSCSTCAVGRYAPWYGATSCTYCAPGTFVSSTGQGSCSPCATGRYTARTGSSDCSACYLGKYSTATGGSSESSCLHCPAGRFSNAEGSSACSACQPGWSSYSQSSNCFICGAGTFASAEAAPGSSSCISCAAGRFSSVIGSTSGFDCQACVAGKHSSSSASTCYTCSEGRYSAAAAPTCTTCPAGRFSATIGATSFSTCEACEAGKYSTTASSICFTCVAGTYSGATAGKCESCPSGHYSPNAGATSLADCKQCSAGKYSLVASSVCYSCGTGSYSASASSTCIDCVAGRYSVTFEAPSVAHCLPCNPGRYASYSGLSHCGSCSAGWYSPAASTTCTRCAAGRYSPEPEAGTCIACSKGTYARFPAAVGCVNCSRGTYAEVTGSTLCVNCPAGRALAIPGATSSGMCQSCAPGTYAQFAASSYCASCERGKYVETTASASCVSCPPGRASYAVSASSRTTCRVCTPGSYNPRYGAETCIPCETGKFTGVSEAPACAPCYPGTYASSTGQSECSQCGTGTYSPSYGRSDCPYCEPGSYNDALGRSSCTLCPAGTSTASIGQTQCQNCSAREFSTLGLSSCQACTPGRYNRWERQHQCRECEAGRYTSVSSSADCFNCSIGRYSRPGWDTCPTCPKGRYTLDIATPECTICPAGNYCANADAPPVECTGLTLCLAGSFEPLPCPRGYICLPNDRGKRGPGCPRCGESGTCLDIFSGLDCSTCPDGFIAVNAYCHQCQESAKYFTLCSLILLSFGIYMYFNARRLVYRVLLLILFNFLATMSVLLLVGIGIHFKIDPRLLAWLKIFDMSVFLDRFECMFGIRVGYYLLLVSLVVSTVLAISALLSVARCCCRVDSDVVHDADARKRSASPTTSCSCCQRQNPNSAVCYRTMGYLCCLSYTPPDPQSALDGLLLKRLWLSTNRLAWMVFIVAFPNTVRMCLNMLKCKYGHLEADFDVSCDTPEYFGFLVFSSAVVLACFALPFVLCRYVQKQQEELQLLHWTDAFHHASAVVYENFDNNAPWYESVILLRKFMLLVAVIMLPTLELRIFSCIGLNAIYLYMITFWRNPYSRIRLPAADIERFCCCCRFLTTSDNLPNILERLCIFAQMLTFTFAYLAFRLDSEWPRIAAVSLIIANSCLIGIVVLVIFLGRRALEAESRHDSPNTLLKHLGKEIDLRTRTFSTSLSLQLLEEFTSILLAQRSLAIHAWAKIDDALAQDSRLPKQIPYQLMDDRPVRVIQNQHNALAERYRALDKGDFYSRTGYTWVVTYCVKVIRCVLRAVFCCTCRFHNRADAPIDPTLLHRIQELFQDAGQIKIPPLQRMQLSAVEPQAAPAPAVSDSDRLCDNMEHVWRMACVLHAYVANCQQQTAQQVWRARLYVYDMMHIPHATQVLKSVRAQYGYAHNIVQFQERVLSEWVSQEMRIAKSSIVERNLLATEARLKMCTTTQDELRGEIKMVTSELNRTSQAFRCDAVRRAVVLSRESKAWHQCTYNIQDVEEQLRQNQSCSCAACFLCMFCWSRQLKTRRRLAQSKYAIELQRNVHEQHLRKASDFLASCDFAEFEEPDVKSNKKSRRRAQAKFNYSSKEIQHALHHLFALPLDDYEDALAANTRNAVYEMIQHEQTLTRSKEKLAKELTAVQDAVRKETRMLNKLKQQQAQIERDRKEVARFHQLLYQAVKQAVEPNGMKRVSCHPRTALLILSAIEKYASELVNKARQLVDMKDPDTPTGVKRIARCRHFAWSGMFDGKWMQVNAPEYPEKVVMVRKDKKKKQKQKKQKKVEEQKEMDIPRPEAMPCSDSDSADSDRFAYDPDAKELLQHLRISVQSPSYPSTSQLRNQWQRDHKEEIELYKTPGSGPDRSEPVNEFVPGTIPLAPTVTVTGIAVPTGDDAKVRSASRIELMNMKHSSSNSALSHLAAPTRAAVAEHQHQSYSESDCESVSMGSIPSIALSHVLAEPTVAVAVGYQVQALGAPESDSDAE